MAVGVICIMCTILWKHGLSKASRTHGLGKVCSTNPFALKTGVSIVYSGIHYRKVLAFPCYAQFPGGVRRIDSTFLSLGRRRCYIR